MSESQFSFTYHRVLHLYYHGKPDHETIFVETHEGGQGTGHVYHVTGTILNGMKYDPRQEGRSEGSVEFHKKERVGSLKRSDYAQFKSICEGTRVPDKQVDLRGRRLDGSKPLRRCGEWVADAIAEMRPLGVLNADND